MGFIARFGIFAPHPRPGVSKLRRQPILACLTEKIKVTTLHLNEALTPPMTGRDETQPTSKLHRINKSARRRGENMGGTVPGVARLAGEAGRGTPDNLRMLCWDFFNKKSVIACLR